MNNHLANEYASALFEVAIEKQSIEVVKDNLILLENTLTSEEDSMRFFTHPNISKDNKKEIIKKTYNNVIDTIVENTLYIMIDNNRFDLLAEVVQEYYKLYLDYNKVIEVQAISTITLTESQIEELSIKLEKRYKHKITINNTIDKSIIGGILLKVNDEVIDDTVKSKISKLKNVLSLN